MTNSLDYESYRIAVVFLTTAGVVVPVFHKLKVSPVLGFLIAGAVLGHLGIGRLAGDYEWAARIPIADVEGVSKLAELGLVFLLFMIGLELTWERLIRLRRLVFGLGLAQLVFCAGVLALIGHYWFKVNAAPVNLDGRSSCNVFNSRCYACFSGKASFK